MKASLNPLGGLGYPAKSPTLTGYAAMRAMSPTATDPFTHPTGTFTATTTSALDNGGTVIDSRTAGVQWVRVGTYNTALAPMQLSWFERAKNGLLIAENGDISAAVARIVSAGVPAPPPNVLPATEDTVGRWLFNGDLIEQSELPYDPTALYLKAPFAVRLSTLHLPWGHVELDLAGPVALQTGSIRGVDTAVDQYVPRGKLFGFDPEPFHLEIDHDGLSSTEQLLTPTNDEQAITIKAAATSGITLRFVEGFATDRIIVEKSGDTQSPFRLIVRPQSEHPTTFLPGTPWRKVMDVPGFPGLIDGDDLVFDGMLSRYVFEAAIPPAGGITEDTVGYWTFDGTLDETATATLDTVTSARRIYFDNWDAASFPVMSFWYRATAPLTATALLEPSGVAGPADTVAIPWDVTANDNWQSADLDVGAALSGNPNGAKVRAVEINAIGAGHYRLAGWSE